MVLNLVQDPRREVVFFVLIVGAHSFVCSAKRHFDSILGVKCIFQGKTTFFCPWESFVHSIVQNYNFLMVVVV